ncbi:MAG: hypothetical protein JXB05_15160 [Myxococcaceae bacterium]|nr:hypothetical protein [Myxococcaceae bacterium]
MKRFMKKLAPVVSLAALGFGSVASAGYAYGAYSCSHSADGSGNCSGTLSAWRSGSQDTAYVTFYELDNGGKTFVARYTVSGESSPTTFSCIPDASVGAIWGDVLAHRGRFYIAWDSGGTCYNLSLYNGSAYSTF